MQRMAKEHGYWGGPDGGPAKPMTDLLFDTQEGRQFYKQMVDAAKQYANTGGRKPNDWG